MTVPARELTEIEAVTVAETVLTWTGSGLLILGATMVIIAIVFGYRRYHAHARSEAPDSYWSIALIGAWASVLLSFIPLSQVLDGGIAGYLERGESDRTLSVGMWAGLFPVLPLVVLIGFVIGGVSVGMREVGERARTLFGGDGTIRRTISLGH